jgi:ABC-type branched-subunit amino acid transport system ATPase component
MKMLELKDITKSFGGVNALTNVSASFEAGKITGIIGANGAGKTTLINIIGGFLKPQSGQVYLHGDNITGLPPWRIARLGVGRLFQNVRIFSQMTAFDNVLVAFKRGFHESFIASIFLRRRVSGRERELVNRTQHLLDVVGLSGQAHVLGKNLSYGQQKLLSIAMLLAAGVKTLMLDEPTAGVSSLTTPILIKLFKALSAEGKTIILIEHDMDVMTAAADWIYFMNAGHIVSCGFPDEVLNDSNVRRSYLGY